MMKTTRTAAVGSQAVGTSSKPSCAGEERVVSYRTSTLAPAYSRMPSQRLLSPRFSLVVVVCPVLYTRVVAAIEPLELSLALPHVRLGAGNGRLELGNLLGQLQGTLSVGGEMLRVSIW